tara:strand:+ start:7404 stop:7628 length:225 start_codon:yes stop_codon:yes gene_type:complete
MFFYFLVGLAFAQDRNVQYEKRTEIDFEAIDVDGQLVKPQGSLIVERGNVKFNPLIELRMDWDLEMAASVREIK